MISSLAGAGRDFTFSLSLGGLLITRHCTY